MQLNSVLLPYQARVAQAMQDKRYNVLIIEKGRRTGITWGVAGIKTIKAAQNPKEGGSNILYIGPSLNMAREFITTCGNWARAYSNAIGKFNIEDEIFEDGSEKGIKALRIDFASGNSVIALSSAPRSIRGFQGDVVIDEAAFHDDLSALMKAAMAMLVWGGHVTLISTHFGDDNPFNQLIKDTRDGRLDCKIETIPFRMAVKQGLYQRICQTKGEKWTQQKEDAWVNKIYADYGEDAAEELDCIPSKSKGAYLDVKDVIACMDGDIPVISHALQDDFKFKEKHIRKQIINDWCEENLLPWLNNISGDTAIGADIARTSDLTSIFVMSELSNTSYYTELTVELRNMPYASQQQIIRYIIDRLPNFNGAAIDATGGGKEIAERLAQHYGSDLIHEVIFSEKTYKELLPPYKRRLEDRMIMIPQNRDIRDDHKLIVKINGVPKIAKIRQGEKGKKRHGDSVVAIILAIYALDQAASNFEIFMGDIREIEDLKGW